jgi:CRISPR-associated endonuclease/helicase Cas3
MRRAGLFWAKSGDKEHPDGHPLVAHMLDTAAVAKALLLREPRRTLQHYAADYGLPVEQALDLAAFFCAMHDLGKASAVFQCEWQRGAERLRAAGLQWERTCLPQRGASNWVAHGVLTETFVGHLLPTLGAPLELSAQVAEALAAHHGFLADYQELDNADDVLFCETGPWYEARRALVQTVWRTTGARVPSVAALTPPAAVRIMALASFSDWLASSPQFFPYGRAVNSPASYYAEAGELADEALRHIRWLPRTPLIQAPVAFDRVFRFKANELQQTVIEVLENTEGQALLIIEAPMGGGKTEAAFYAHMVLQARNGHRGLYVAMPTQATGNAMYDRVREFLEPFGQNRPLDLQLLHGAALINPEYESLLMEGVGDRDSDRVAASTWFSARKRAMLTEYGVGTVDQALLGVLRVRHHFIRLWGLGNRTVVLDEVHAYDAYTSRLIAALVRWLWSLGSSIVLMSATLPSAQRRELLKAAATELPEPEAPYPRVTALSNGILRSQPVSWTEEQTVELGAVQREPAVLAHTARRLVEHGGVAAVITNTVDRAQAVYSALGSGSPLEHATAPVGKRVGDLEVYIFHARYPSEVRKGIEGAVLGRMGKDTDRPARALVIATQVIEQSLDLDFDVMLSDLAPADLLLQRVGRLHRHRNTVRPRHLQRPTLLVAGLDDNPPDFSSDYWDKVYCAYPLYTTWLLLRSRDRILLPADIEPLVEATYDETMVSDFPDELKDTVGDALQELQRIAESHSLRARQVVIDPPVKILERLQGTLIRELRLEDDEESRLPQVALTRLGSPSVTVVPAYRINGQLYLDREATRPLVLKGRIDKNQTVDLFRHSLKVGRSSVYRELMKRDAPSCWRQQGLLRSWRVLELDPEGRAQFGKTTVRLDRELGLVYE